MTEHQITFDDIADEQRNAIESYLAVLDDLDDRLSDVLTDFKYDENLDLPIGIQHDIETTCQCLTRIRYWLRDELTGFRNRQP